MKRRALLVAAGAAAVPAALVGSGAVRPWEGDDEPPVQRASTAIERAEDRRPGIRVEPVCYRVADGAWETEWTFRVRNRDERAIAARWRAVDYGHEGSVTVPAGGSATFRVRVGSMDGPTVAVYEGDELVGVADPGETARCRSKG